jgi:hypothetical protein
MCTFDFGILELIIFKEHQNIQNNNKKKFLDYFLSNVF